MIALFVLQVALLGQVASVCDASLWQHVYKPQRLTVLAPCVTVTGTIVDATRGRRQSGVRREADGDTHGWLHRHFLRGLLLGVILMLFALRAYTGRDSTPAMAFFATITIIACITADIVGDLVDRRLLRWFLLNEKVRKDES